MIKTFEYLINSINSEININAKYDEAENIYCRLFSLLYDWNDLVNLNYEKPNYPGIDLYETKKRIGIQITALTTQYPSEVKKKVTDSLSKYYTNSSIIKYTSKEVIIFFINDTKATNTFQEHNIAENIRKDSGYKIEVKTSNSIISDYQRLTDFDQRNYILELLNHEYTKNKSGKYDIVFFKYDKFLLNKNNYIFTEQEKEWSSEIKQLFQSNVNEVLLIGHPCIGKTTFALRTATDINKNQNVFYLNLNNPDLTTNYQVLFNDIKQIGFNHSVLIIDDIHSNFNIFNAIRERLLKNTWIKTIYISREIEQLKLYSKSISNKLHLSDKVNNQKKVKLIIQSRLSISGKANVNKENWQYIKEKYSGNLIHLDIALNAIEDPKSELKISNINEDDILYHFYHHQNIAEHESQSLYFCSFLGSLDLPIESSTVNSSELKSLISGGLLSKLRV